MTDIARMARRKRCLILLALALGACGGSQDTSSQPSPDAAATSDGEANAVRIDIPVENAAREAAITESVSNDSAADALAFWSHPTLAFNSLLITAGDQAIRSFNIEDGSPVATYPVGATALAIYYDGTGETATGNLVARETDGTVRILAIDNLTRDFAARGSLALPAQSLCVIDRPDTDILVALNGATASGYALEDDGARPLFTHEHEAPIVACAGQPDAPGYYAIDAAGRLLTASYETERSDTGDSDTGGSDGALTLLANTGLSDIAGLAAIVRTPSDTRETPFEVTLAVFDNARGALFLFDGADGHQRGKLRLSASFDYDGVERARAFSAGFDNYGAVYRDGVAAFALDDGAVRLVSWNSILNALDLERGQTVSARSVVVETDDLPFELDIPIPQP